MRKKEGNNILVVVAHPDDEALGCIGTLYKHLEDGSDVSIMFMTDGVSARVNASNLEHKERKKYFNKAVKFFPYFKHKACSFPDNAMDTIAFIEIVREVETFISEINPAVIYTHFESDLNIDHRICYQAVMTACRPLPRSKIKEIYSFEVLSSTEWCVSSGKTFNPNYYVNIKNSFNKKIEYLKCYEGEMRDFPHPRSYENIEAIAKFRGASSGLEAAEAFVINRIIER
jgi:N-acetylglucosamine malate deacetylase 1